MFEWLYRAEYILQKLTHNLLFLLAAVIVFLVHEMGHYIVAALCRVNVASVVIGLGDEVWSRRGSNGTYWSVRAFPVCGAVHLQTAEGQHIERSFDSQSVWKRMLIVAAGPFTNMLLAFAALLLFYTAAGVPSLPPLVTGVETGSPADKAGLRPGDKIVTMDGDAVWRFDDISARIEKAPGQTVPVTYERAGHRAEAKIIPYLASYRDVYGFQRAHGRSGMLVLHKPLYLSAVAEVAGQETKGDDARTRRLLLQAMDRDVKVGVKGLDGKTHVYTVHMSGALNKGLKDPGSPDYGWVYLGAFHDNFYFHTNARGALRTAWMETARLTAGLTHILTHLERVDKSLIDAETVVRESAAPVKYVLFGFAHTVAALSICIGLINLLPLPGMDGSFLLALALESVVGKARAKTLRPYVLRLAALLLIAGWLLFNLEPLGRIMS